MKLNSLKFAVAGSLAIFIAASSAFSEEGGGKIPPASDKKDLTWDKDIKPIVDVSCIKCHKGEKPKGKLSLETLAGALKGGKEGMDIVPGKGADSLIVKAASYATSDDELYMPPPKNKAGIAKLTDEQIGLIRAWIDQGAK